MKVKVGNFVFDAKYQPVMVILSSKDKEDIANMHANATLYLGAPEDMSEDEVISFMELDRAIKIDPNCILPQDWPWGPKHEGQLFRAEWVDADHLFLTPENNPQSLVPKVLAIRWNGDNIDDFKPFGNLIQGPYLAAPDNYLLVTLHDGSRVQVQVGEWVIRDSQGNMNPQSKHVEVVDKITLHDGITYELKYMRMEYAGKTASESLFLQPMDSKPTITQAYAIRWNGDNFGEIASRSELVYGPYGQENAHLEVESVFGRVRVDVGEWVMFSDDDVKILASNFMKSFDSKIYILKKIDESHIEWVRTSSISRPDRLTDSPIP
jgi:hypothetical protein